MCRFCSDNGNGGGELIIEQRYKQIRIPLCSPCGVKFNLHGVVVCKKCGNVYLRNDGNYVVEYLSDCERCHVNVVPFVLRNRNGTTA